jgi:hypothetical protein
MAWNITYHTETVESFVLGLPDGLLARYLKLTDMMLEFGVNLGMPHTRPMSDGLFELGALKSEVQHLNTDKVLHDECVEL